MSDNEIENESTSGTTLREKLESALARIKSLEVENASLSKVSRGFDLNSSLTAAGVTNLSTAKFFPADIDPKDQEAVKKWVDDSAEVFNFQIKTGSEPVGTTTASESVTATEVPNVNIPEAKRIQNLNQSGTIPGKYNTALSSIDSANSIEEINASLAQARNVTV